MLKGVKKLNYLARAIGDEVDTQNQLIDRITGKVSSSHPLKIYWLDWLTIYAERCCRRRREDEP